MKKDVLKASKGSNEDLANVGVTDIGVRRSTSNELIKKYKAEAK